MPFVSLAPETPFHEIVAPIRDRVDGLSVLGGALDRGGICTYEVAAHWSLYVENYPWGVSLNVVTPLAPDRTRVTFTPFVAIPELRDSGAGAGLDLVEAQDERIVEQVQRGVVSRLARQGRLVPGAEKGIESFREVLRASLRV